MQYARITKMDSRPKKFLDLVCYAIRVKHYARNTEQTYVYWIKKYVLFHNKHHPKEMGTSKVQAMLHERSGIYQMECVSSRRQLLCSVCPGTLGPDRQGGMVRVGPVHYNTLEEIERFGEVLRRLAVS